MGYLWIFQELDFEEVDWEWVTEESPETLLSLCSLPFSGILEGVSIVYWLPNLGNQR